ncbi:hypothetical protein N9985_00335 [Gammaproteobacteria bacterium]|nr:hypothetical protein [Gammaproteobacteria bacterium]
MQKILFRYFMYALAVIVINLGLLAAAHYLPGSLQFDRVVSGVSAPTSEFSPVELLQNILLLACIAIFGWVASRDRLRRPMAMAFVSIFSACLVRELDFFLDFYVVDNFWQVLCAIIISFVLVYVGRDWPRFQLGWRRSWPSAGLAIVIGGLILLVPYAQLIGHEPLWRGVMGDSYLHIVKVIAEEFVELGAYLLITIGSVEFLYAWSRLPRTIRSVQKKKRR